jgi:hypothetical protein
LAIPTDIHGEQIFTTLAASMAYNEIPTHATTFQQWTAQLPPAEKRMVSSVYFDMCDAEFLLLQYMQLPCTLFIRTDEGKRHHSESYSWIICSPSREQLCLNAGPVDGWLRCQNSLRSEAAALAAVTLYLDELATWAEFDLQCNFRIYADSTSAISNANLLNEQVPKRRYADNADILSVMRSAEHIIIRFILEHVNSNE